MTMSVARIENGDRQGRLRLSGELTYATVPELSRSLEPTLKQWPRLCVDLSGLDRVDSAGLALLVEWTRLAHALGHPLEFIEAPQQLLTIARVSGLDRTLPFSSGGSGADAGNRRTTGDRL